MEVIDKFANEVACNLPEEGQGIPVDLAEEAKNRTLLSRSTTQINVVLVSYSKHKAEVAELADAPA